MTETISYFNSRRSDVHVILLDATKAFDRLKYSKLYKLLYERGVCPLVIRLLINMYKVNNIGPNAEPCGTP